MTAPASQPGEDEQDPLADHAVAAWPTARTADETPVADGWSWGPAPAQAASPEPAPAQDQTATGANAEEASQSWAVGSSDVVAGESPDTPTTAPEPFPPSNAAETAPTGAVPDDRLDRADQLLSELRQLIAASPTSGGRDLSGVISELEVATMAPGAMPEDELAALREAIFAARERPRDLDTVVDLTGRIDALVALVIAYDRAAAAIERALDVLREPREANAR